MLLRLLVLIVAMVFWATALAQPARIIVLRHAEKTDDPENIHLSLKGRERAMALVPYLTESPEFITNGLPVALFAAGGRKPGRSVRPQETLEPLAMRLRLMVRTEFSNKESQALARYVSTEASYRGKTVVICWVHEHMPELIEALGGKQDVGKKWKSGVFDRVYIIENKENTVTVKDLPQKLLFGDSKG